MSDRSDHMRRVRRRDTRPEMIVRRELWSRGLRYRLQARDLPGTPDLVFRGARLVVFVHGCFWHRHEGCRRASTPKTNTEYWLPKFERNVERDRRKERELKELGWDVVVVWECEASDEAALRERGDEIERRVRRRGAEGGD